jgi:hypothetical protein
LCVSGILETVSCKLLSWEDGLGLCGPCLCVVLLRVPLEYN